MLYMCKYEQLKSNEYNFECSLRAADWNLSTPDWKGRMKIVTRGDQCSIKLEDRTGGNQ